jgi:two-component system response regulator FixJ
MPNSGIVHLIDDDDAMRDSLRFLLTSAGVEVRDYPSATAFLSSLRGGGIDGCVVTDVRMPDMTGLELLRRLHADHPGVPVIVMTGHGDVALAVEAMKSGAVDFLEKPFDDDALLARVTQAFGRRNEDNHRLAEREESARRIGQLSPRERDVLAGLVAGKPNKVIAGDLGISPRTVEVYRANLMAKLQAQSLSALVRIALLAGFPESGPDSR